MAKSSGTLTELREATRILTFSLENLRVMAEQQVPEQSGSTPTDASQPQAAPPEAGRRRLLQGGLAAGPVILTLFSRPALGWGTPGTCTTPSGFLSGNLSQHGNPTSCSGRTPGYCKQLQHFAAWPAPYFPTTVSGSGGHQATKFHSATTGFNGTQFGTQTMLQVLETGGNAGGYTALGRHITAALLNAAAGLTPVLSVTDVRNIWNEYVLKGYFEPSAGIKWYPDQIVEYLVTTMPL